jgi:transcriptional regulator with XRE-family HTH domain
VLDLQTWGMPAHERMRAFGLRQADHVTRRLGREARELRQQAGVSQRQLSQAVGVSRHWIYLLEHGRLRTVDVRRVTVLMAHLGHKLVASTYPTGEPLRDEGQARLLERFNARLSPSWRRFTEAPMPASNDLRAWDELLRGPVSIGVEAETRPADLQAVTRAMQLKMRDSGVDRMVIVISSSGRNRRMIQTHVGLVRQVFPLDTRATLAALADGRDPGANGLVLI